MQTNKIKLFDSDYKSQQQDSVKIFLKFIFLFLLYHFDLQLNYSLFIFWSSTKSDGKSYCISIKTFFWSSLKINEKKSLHFVVFKPHPPKKLFCAPSPQTHYSGAGPASNCLKRPKPAQVSILVPNCIFAIS